MFDKLLEKFEDKFEPVSPDEIERRVASMNNDQLIDAIIDLIENMSSQQIIEMHENLSNLSIVEIALERLEAIVEEEKDRKKLEGIYWNCLEL